MSESEEQTASSEDCVSPREGDDDSGEVGSLRNKYTRAGSLGSIFPEDGEQYKAVILGSQCIKKSKSKKAFTTYRIHVSDRNGNVWNTLRRYSEFRTLKTQLKAKYPEVAFPGKFPPKKILNNLTPGNIDHRHQQLQTWFNKILKDPVVGNCSIVQNFLEEIKLDAGEDIVNKNGEICIKSELGHIGFLYILSKGKFKKRWFALRNNVLYQYRSHLDKHPYKQYVWQDFEVVEVQSTVELEVELYCFRVSSQECTKIFATPDPSECEAWMAALDQLNHSKP